MTTLLHAYSRNNAGDGLLVDLSQELIRETVGNDLVKIMIAADARSFGESDNVVGVDVDRPTLIGRIGFSLVSLYKLVFFCDERLLPKRAQSRAKDSRVVIAVGGGYLRAGTCIESLKTLICHGPQLKFAACSEKKTVYLPQSIGPFRGPIGWLIKRWLRRVDHVFLRDNRSTAECELISFHRVPDLAVQEVGMRKDVRPRELRRNAPVYLVARRVKDPEHQYEASLRKLIEGLPNIVPVLQSRGRGNDDESYYDRLGFCGPYPTLDEATVAEPGVVLSVRLHGAIQAILNGCPSIHLSYERKGFGAYEDLGLDDYVYDCKRFDTDAVMRQVVDLQKDAAGFWEKVGSSQRLVRESRSKMIHLIKEVSALESDSGL